MMGNRPHPRGRESHHELMSHRLNCEPSGSKKMLELRQPRKVMEHQHGSGRELPVGTDPVEITYIPRKEKLTQMVY